jgi:hypothetical protein
MCTGIIFGGLDSYGEVLSSHVEVLKPNDTQSDNHLVYPVPD